MTSVNAPDFSICDKGVIDSSPAVAARPGRFLPDLDRRRKPRSFFAAIGWNGRSVFTPARESEGWHQTEVDALMGNDAVHHLRHHGINAVKYRAVGQEDEIPVALIQESKLNTNLLVMRRYGPLAPARIGAGQHHRPDPATCAISLACRALNTDPPAALFSIPGEELTAVKVTP